MRTAESRIICERSRCYRGFGATTSLDTIRERLDRRTRCSVTRHTVSRRRLFSLDDCGISHRTLVHNAHLAMDYALRAAIRPQHLPHHTPQGFYTDHCVFHGRLTNLSSFFLPCAAHPTRAPCSILSKTKQKPCHQERAPPRRPAPSAARLQGLALAQKNPRETLEAYSSPLWFYRSPASSVISLFKGSPTACLPVGSPPRSGQPGMPGHPSLGAFP